MKKRDIDYIDETEFIRDVITVKEFKEILEKHDDEEIIILYADNASVYVGEELVLKLEF